jgi:hypothetical protein
LPLYTTGCSQASTTSISIVFAATDCTTCAAGFAYSTSTSSCIPVCPDPTCSGHGTCGDNDGVAVCGCDSGWTGNSCELPDCPTYGGYVCNLRGTCGVSASGPTCTCNSGFVPPYCLPTISVAPTGFTQTNTSVAPPSAGISTSGDYICSGATCGRGADGCTSQGSCSCMANFTGNLCENPVCPNSCSSNGNCDGTRLPPVCICAGNWVGTDCSTPGESGDASAVIAGLPKNAFIGIMAAVAFVVIAAVVVITIFTVNRRARHAARPFADRVVSRSDNL